MNDTTQINPSEAKLTMDGTGIVLHIMIAGVLVGFTVLSWTQLKINNPEQRQSTFSSVKNVLKSTSNITISMFSAMITEITKDKVK